MSLVSIPFVGTNADIGLHIVATAVLVVTFSAVIYGFWRVHEIPISKAHVSKHQQIGLITVLTWVGFIWHWVWVVSVIVAYWDTDKTFRKIKSTWNEVPTNAENTNQQEGR